MGGGLSCCCHVGRHGIICVKNSNFGSSFRDNTIILIDLANIAHDYRSIKEILISLLY